MKTVYLAAPWAQRVEAEKVSKQIEKLGYKINHKWWEKEAGDDEHLKLQEHAGNDLLAVLSCDVFVMLNLEKSEGKSVESGLALSRRQIGFKPRMIGVGKRGSNIFQWLSFWEWAPDTGAMLKLLA